MLTQTKLETPMNIDEHQRQQAEKAYNLADALSDFLKADAAFEVVATAFNKSNAKEGSPRWKQLEEEMNEAGRPREEATMGLLKMIEQIAGIRYRVTPATVARDG